MAKETCALCNEVLKEQVVALDGFLFCSKCCALDHIKSDLISNLDGYAESIYNESAETILLEDIT